jgi:hypothetical protein
MMPFFGFPVVVIVVSRRGVGDSAICPAYLRDHPIIG